MFVKVFICSIVPTLILRWCIHRIYMVEGSMCGLFSSSSMVGSLYISMYAGMCMITWISEKRPMKGVKFWYQLLSGMVSMVMVWGSFLAASVVQCIVFWASVSLCEWTYPIPFHL